MLIKYIVYVTPGFKAINLNVRANILYTLYFLQYHTLPRNKDRCYVLSHVREWLNDSSGGRNCFLSNVSLQINQQFYTEVSFIPINKIKSQDCYYKFLTTTIRGNTHKTNHFTLNTDNKCIFLLVRTLYNQTKQVGPPSHTFTYVSFTLFTK